MVRDSGAPTFNRGECLLSQRCLLQRWTLGACEDVFIGLAMNFGSIAVATAIVLETSEARSCSAAALTRNSNAPATI
jgi:hypothetical protein